MKMKEMNSMKKKKNCWKRDGCIVGVIFWATIWFVVFLIVLFKATGVIP